MHRPGKNPQAEQSDWCVCKKHSSLPLLFGISLMCASWFSHRRTDGCHHSKCLAGIQPRANNAIPTPAGRQPPANPLHAPLNKTLDQNIVELRASAVSQNVQSRDIIKAAESTEAETGQQLWLGAYVRLGEQQRLFDSRW
jgi:hypothetical protein